MGSLFKKKKRKFLRVRPAEENPVRVDINGVDFLDILTAQNISEGGLAVVVPHEFTRCEIDRPVSLIVTLPPPVQEEIAVNGIIRYISQSRKLFGVAFIGLKDEGRMKIRRYVTHRIKDEPPERR